MTYYMTSSNWKLHPFEVTVCLLLYSTSHLEDMLWAFSVHLLTQNM